MDITLSFKEIIQLLKDHKQFIDLSNEKQIDEDNKNSLIKNLSFDSREYQKNGLFFCKGANFKEEYLADAISNGATSYLIEEKLLNKLNINVAIPGIIVKNSQKSMALVAMHFYGYPQKKLRLIGITGTKGKTTTAFFIKSILDQQNGHKTALFSTVSTDVGNGSFPSTLTTPESLDLYCLMNQAVEQGYTDLVMEVSSQAYLMNRVFQLHYDLGIFLNIFPDHIGENEHPDFEDYLAHKLKLFKHSEAIVVHSNTLALPEIKQAVTENSAKVIWTGIDQENQGDIHYTLGETENHEEHVTFEVLENSLLVTGEPLTKTNFQLNLFGSVNLENALVAIAATRYLGCSEEEIQKGLAQVKVPGRMEMIVDSKRLIVVDYAHNGISLKKLLIWANSYYPKGKKIVVFGCPGDKGISRRKDLGEIAAQLADYVILTEDDPGFEDSLAICQEVGTHLEGFVPFEIEIDRPKAIKKGLDLTESGDILLVIGKGSDNFQKRKGINEPYLTDRQVVEDTLNIVSE
ncbi:Mur ligase family protein [Carnobacterium gallinarum]|uniref:Mur ligase family protein n=1 Tax=Carnobacterium gallinarum TaxID=2749 RepID=UPI000553C08D|nr:UDP-N-acetylmuramyl-tripeptide synthetase [Carnobacterium gallinarum]